MQSFYSRVQHHVQDIMLWFRSFLVNYCIKSRKKVKIFIFFMRVVVLSCPLKQRRNQWFIFALFEVTLEIYNKSDKSKHNVTSLGD